MVKVVFDFNHIPDLPAFYRAFSQNFALSEDFGANLDALWDVVTGEIALPVEIEFVHFSRRHQRRFAAIVLLLEEAEEELAGRLHFNVVDEHIV
ncbi:ribonuclease inhibitor [Yersinia pestis]|uniref:Ribonuclease inhibitor n=12 Tax=Yersinia pseudotuberculosis complex TaxID=1649845 RepID=A0AAX2HWG4_YERPE|nr:MULTISPECIES: barstar family protein [Yersinia pseudotuberculosis complex]EDR33172.1 barstar [Yersinia pestis biovar Orientalis str. IP275]EFA47851.1 barstar (barnase inhibitor) [Yersinia pestis KIM D27]ERP79411.1 hypothetical protein L328_18300 [Yersinia pestis 24H]ERP79689.1 hypothetical protein L327_18365 [Yersinia pestis S3]CQD57641.1 putative ribonuclease inhibitor [Yersinia intermedia]